MLEAVQKYNITQLTMVPPIVVVGYSSGVVFHFSDC
jgi:hypothetical protein